MRDEYDQTKPISYLITEDAMVGDMARPDRFSTYGVVERIEDGFMFFAMEGGGTVQTDLASLPINRVLPRNQAQTERGAKDSGG